MEPPLFESEPHGTLDKRCSGCGALLMLPRQQQRMIQPGEISIGGYAVANPSRNISARI